jgi:terminase large subunit-like protein
VKASSKNYTSGALAATSPLYSKLVNVTGEAFPTEAAFRDKFLSEYQPHDAQKKLATAMIENRFITTVAGRRSGKTYGGGREFLKRIVRDFNAARGRGETWTPPARFTDDTKPLIWYWCVAPTYALGIYQRREIFEILGGVDSALVLRYVGNMLWLRGGILIEFKSADNPLSLVGSGLNGMWADEAARIKESAWSDNLRPALSDRLGWALFTTTPLGKNWVYSDLWQVERKGYANVHFRTVDNTALPHLVEEVAEARATLSKALFLKNYEASFDAFEGKIFEEYLDDEMHVVSSIPNSVYRRFAGIDWGHSNPGVNIEVGLSLDGYLYAYREDYVRELPITPPPLALKVDSWTNRFKAGEGRGVSHGWADPSEPANIILCRQRKLDIRRADNSVNPGIDLLATLLKPVPRADGTIRPSLYIHKDCENLRRELSSYRWGDNGKPVKEDDHAVDALRYAVYTEAKRNRLFVTDKISRKLGFDAFELAA